MKIVLDTDVLVSGLLQPFGPSGFLEVALAGGAQCLVTGNARHYPVEARSGVEVLSPRSFIELYRARQGN